MTAIALTISNIPVRQDAAGRFCLNDLHKAAGGEKRHQPSDWLRIQQTQELVAELENYDPGIPGTKKAIETIQGKGKAQGTYVVKELVYAYAMWISAKFHIAVIRAYDSLVTGTLPPHPTPEPKTKKALPGKLTLSMQDEIKDLVKSRAEALPKDKRAKATISMWSAIKSKYGCSYKEVAEDQFTGVVGLVARLPLEGELLEKSEPLPAANILPVELNMPQGMQQVLFRFSTEGLSYGRWFMTLADGVFMIRPMADDELSMRPEQWQKYMKQERGYIVVKKTEVLKRLEGQ